jgi:molecular chaperone DnaJ
VFGQFINIAPCTSCSGTGEILQDKCGSCSGEGRIEGETTVKVTIPAGVRTGNYIPLTGKGHAGRRGGQAGDAMVVIEEQEHEFFERNDDDVHMRFTIDFPTAALGGEVTVPTLGGEAVLSIDPGTQPGSVLKMKGKGIPHVNQRGTGDQLVHIDIYVPTKLSSEERSALKKLASSKHFSASEHKQTGGFFQRMKEAIS